MDAKIVFNRKRFLILFRIFCLIQILVYASSVSALDATVIRFKAYSVDDGLADNVVRAITQDKLGYIWIGTELGLSKFDGTNLINYSMTIENGLSNNYVQAIALDSIGNLWVGTEHGLNKYLPATDSFSSFTTINSQLNSNVINALVAGKDHTLWIGTDLGLEKYNVDTKLFTRFNLKSKNDIEETQTNIKSLLLTRNADLWIGTTKGLIQLPVNANNPKRIQWITNEQPKIRALVEDKSGNVWIGSDQGLHFYDTNTQTITKKNKVIKQQNVRSLLHDKSGNLWVGTLKDGVYKLSENGTYSHFIQDKGDDKSLGDMTLLSLFEDESGSIWMGTYEAGIHWFDPNVLSMGAHDTSLNSFSCLPSEIIFSALPISKENLIFGTGSGLSLVNLTSKSCKNFRHSELDSNSISNNEVYVIFKDSADFMWIGTAKGLDKIDIELSRVIRYGHKFSEKVVYSIQETNNQRIILGTNKGVYISNPTKEDFFEIPYDDPIVEPSIYTMNWDQSGNLWLGTTEGLLFIDKELKKIELAYKFPELDFDTRVRSVYIINERTILISIDSKGLFEFDIKTKMIKDTSNKFDINILDGFAGFHEDQDGYVWLSTYNSGLFRLNPEQEGSFQYEYSDGLVSNYVMPRSSTTLVDGSLFFGSRSGFSIFNPSELKKNTATTKIAITDLILNGNRIRPFEDYDGFSINQPVSDLTDLILLHNNNTIGFELTTFHYSQPEKNSYAYKLEGVNDNWVMAKAGNNGVTFDDLGAGEYVFRVKAASTNSIWGEEKSINIIVLPAPWLTWWAKILYVIIAMITILLVFHYRTLALRKRAEYLETLVNDRTEDLAQEKQVVEKLLAQKGEEFANISHEFRTPLTLILGPIQNLLRSNLRSTTRDKLEMAKRNGYRLLRMVDQLLHMEKFRVQKITAEEPQAIKPMFTMIAQSFQELTKEKNIELIIDTIDDVWIQFTPDALEKILLNLLSNAIKYTEEGGKITLSVTKGMSGQVKIIVKDTGIGISKEQQVKVFERYQRVLDEHSEKITGAGIGLALVKELVEAHSGTVELESTPGEGSTFTVTLLHSLSKKPSIKDSSINTEILELELESIRKQSVSTVNQEVIEDIDSNETQLKLLIIEDNPDMRSYIIETLSAQYHCIGAANGKEGVALAFETIPDLIISDIMMPEMDGYEVSQMLKEDEKTSHIPLILLTARGDKESRMRGWRRHVDEYLTKPFDAEELVMRVENLISIRNILRQRFSKESLEGKSVSQLEQIGLSKRDQEFIQKINNIIEDIIGNSEFQISEMASRVAMSERQLQRKLKAVLDYSPNEYLRSFRLNKSKKLLLEGSRVGDVAEEVGFSSQAYFAKCFKAQFGMTAKQYQLQD